MPSLRSLFLVQLGEGIQRGKKALDVQHIGPGFDPMAPVIFPEVLPEIIKDMAGHIDVDRGVQKVLMGQS